MLDNIFFQVLNMSFTASFVILFVLLARLLLKKAPAVCSYALWSVVLFRLVCPFSFESALSLLRINPAPVSAELLYSPAPRIDTGVDLLDSAINPILPAPASPVTSVNPLQIWALAAEAVWIAGVACLLLYSAVSLLRLRRRLVGAVEVGERIYLADHIPTPFVLGLLRPKIYLPSSLTEQEQRYILLHERAHIRRLDHIVKPVAFLTLCVHWFNPLVWAAFLLCCKDMELSCDESVMRRMGDGARADYSALLLRLATGHRRVAAAPLAFGEGDTRRRIQHVLHYRRPALWVSLAALAAVAAVCIGLAVNPGRGEAGYWTVAFPAYQDGKDEYNASIYETEPFHLSVVLPDGWTIQQPADGAPSTPFPFLPGYTPLNIVDGGAYIGAICFNIFEPYEDEIPQEEYYKTVYPELRLGSLYSWQEYTPVVSSPTAETALATVYMVLQEDSLSAAESPTLEVPGILSYDTGLGAYVAIQFAEGAATEEQLQAIAQSIRLART